MTYFYFISYGFVTFEKKEAALDAIRNLHGTLVGSKRIKGKQDRTQKERQCVLIFI